MIIGTGQLAKTFYDNNIENSLIFASGVSNSNCIDINEFKREEILLLNTLKKNFDKKFIYFSSCVLSVENYEKNAYYNHKKRMEEIIKNNSSNYYIFRIPQLFGNLKTHHTLINFLYISIINEKKFNIYDEAYRYVIEINDVKFLVEKYVEYSSPNIIRDLANPYKYKVMDIVNIFETLLNKKANYEIVNKKDDYTLNLDEFIKFIDNHKISINFSQNYLIDKLSEKIKG